MEQFNFIPKYLDAYRDATHYLQQFIFGVDRVQISYFPSVHHKFQSELWRFLFSSGILIFFAVYKQNIDPKLKSVKGGEFFFKKKFILSIT